MRLNFIPGIPSEDGWYFVRLVPGHNQGDKPYDVDYCRGKSRSNDGGREWMRWYEHNISHYAIIPDSL